MNYKTQLGAARNKSVTPEMIAVANEEKVDLAELRTGISKGEVIIPRNIKHKKLVPSGVGKGLRTKINVNLGVSKDCCDFDLEMDKVRMAIDLKADAIMDLSSTGRTREFRQRLIESSPVMVGTVPIYDAIGYYDRELSELSAEELLNVVRIHAEDGVDFMTIHAGLNRDVIKRFQNNPRLMNIVSRGGSLLYLWMQTNNKENPFYEHFDELLMICREYDVTLSLGDACRPGAIKDGTDPAQVAELMALGELTLRAWEKDVQVMIEGPGHMRLNEIEANILLEKKLCHGAPFYVLGPIVTDVAPGYDHITSAIGGAVAAAHGADFLCYVTPAEHIKLPDAEELKEGVIAARIAAHAGDLAQGLSGADEWDYEMSKARQELDWERMFSLAIDPEKPRLMRENSRPEQEDTCTMCGKICAVRNMNRALAK